MFEYSRPILGKYSDILNLDKCLENKSIKYLEVDISIEYSEAEIMSEYLKL